LTAEERKEICSDDFLINGRLNFGKHLLNKKVLLIDDNAMNGWQATLEKIFDCPVTVISSYEDLVDIDQAEYSSYDIIFLDLYMPLKTGYSVGKNYESSLAILKDFKMMFPHIPVVVFTASNKLWTLREVMQMGADGMYVKESPEYARDNDHSKQNFRSFVQIIKEILEKYKILRPYWQHIQSILSDTDFTTISDSPQKLRSRMVERLKMFYGLLKKGFEQWEYDKETFFYSDYELSFITLWSVLNEVQEAYFQKTQPAISINLSSNTYTTHPNRVPLTYLDRPQQKHHKWVIGADVFCEYDYFFELDSSGTPLIVSRSWYKLKHEQKSTFFLRGSQFDTDLGLSRTKVDYEKDIRMQIAFILIKKFGCGNSDLDPYICKLNKSLVIRNHLYLTHGDTLDLSYYNDTEEMKRLRATYSITPQGAIKELFELVAFLLTGKSFSIVV
jgi:DNA-binding NarL/FixJ family response regulator